MSSTEMPDEIRSRRYIHINVYGPQPDAQLPEVHGPPPDVQLLTSSRIKIKLVAGGNVQKLSMLKVKPNPALNPPAIVTWIIDVGDLSDSTKFEFELYDRRYSHLLKKLLTGRTKSTNMSDLVKGAPTISVYNNATPRLKICTLNAYRISMKEAVGDSVDATNEPRTPSEGAGEFLQILQVAGTILDKLSEIHPIAQATSGILSFALNTYKKQAETDELVLKLCRTMKSIHEDANSERALQKQEDLTGIYNSMFEKTFECCVFINNYVKKGFFGRLSILNASDTVTKYQKEFSDFKEDLSSALIKNTNYVANETRVIVDETRQTVKKTDEGVDALNTKKLLEQLKPQLSLGPKCRCLEHTRVKTNKILDSWIKDGHPDKRVLWCSGMAGTGKSSLAGTLHDKFGGVADSEGGRLRGRLGAFIRYDRTEKSPDMLIARLIPSIAFSLGQLDGRIGHAIAKVLNDSPGVRNTAAPNQYKKLLYEPLKSVPELVQEEPLVIIIDGLDECKDLVISDSHSDHGSDGFQQDSHDSSQVPQGDREAVEEVLAVLSKGFQDLTFMRLVVFSRRVNPITAMFEKKGNIVESLLLNKSTDPILDDIQRVIDTRLEKIGDESSDFRDVLERYPDAAKDLASKANGLFIWADVACRYLATCKSEEVLMQLLSINASDNAAEHSDDNDWEGDALKGLHRLYISALNEAAEGNQYVKNHIMKVLGAIMVARTPPGLTPDDLAKLVLGSRETSAKDILDKLGSVVDTDTKSGGFIRLIHKSFDDFLMAHTTLQGKNSWFIDIKDHQMKLAQKCLSVLTNFLKEWSEGSDIPSHIRNYTLLGLLWHIKWFDKNDVKDLCVLFKDDLSAKWFKAIDEAGKNHKLLREILEVLHWVDSLKDIDCSFRQLIYRTCQCAESMLLSTETQPTIKSQNVFWHNILPYSDFVKYIQACFSVSADSQVLIATKDCAFIRSWDINDIGVQAIPVEKPVSSFFNLEESLPALKDPHYHVLGHLVACQSMIMGDPSVDDHGAHWEVINSNGLFTTQPRDSDQSVSAFISISNIQTSYCHHYLFKDLKEYHLLLYSTGFIIINTQAMVLMRINVHTTAKYEWINIEEGEALQVEHSSLWLGESHVPHTKQGSPFLIVSQDGSTVAHLSQLVDGDLWVLQCWNTATGATISRTLNIHQQKHVSLALSASGTISIIVTSEDLKTLHIVPFDNGGVVHEVIDSSHVWSFSRFPQVVASFPNKQKIAYLMNNVMVIRDIQAKKDIFRHCFLCEPSHILITPDGKTLITVHPIPDIIRTWSIEGL
ncbi:hypothetical protein EV421DRAFT_247724 [Armillaria borealis]|uniref:Nephrocystin 3-like N-terminal domain-containing protein n=1 Tax=Armillaria borealis TaxID=47425 RepID=A0AA39IUB3_9AGAR|nr:hypothetical protein EV421DRAFT_247724 [Armillaria borealis]